jgi:hypothetical protein
MRVPQSCDVRVWWCPSPEGRGFGGSAEREAIAMASKDKGGSKSSKKQASQTLKQKREAKKAKKAAAR